MRSTLEGMPETDKLSVMGKLNVMEGMFDDLGIPMKERSIIRGKVLCGYKDISQGNFRFIHENHIDQIHKNELIDDPEGLGHYNAEFIAHRCDITYVAVKAMQENNLNHELGKLIIDLGKVDALVREGDIVDGYGNYFAPYDHETHYDTPWYGFKVDGE